MGDTERYFAHTRPEAAIMRKEGDWLILELAPKHSIDRLLAVLATLEDLPEEERLPEVEDLPPEPLDL